MLDSWHFLILKISTYQDQNSTYYFGIDFIARENL